MPELYIYERGKTGSEIQIWPGAESAIEGTIQEGKNYILEMRNIADPESSDLFIDDIQLDALRSPNRSTARWQWSPGFYAGSVDIRLTYVDGHEDRFDLVTDPDLRKLTRNDFDLMVREILEDTYALFSLSSFRVGISRGTGKDSPPIARLEFLRSRIERLEKIVREIDRRPVRILKANEEWIPYHKAKTSTGIEILRSFSSGQIVKEKGTPRKLPESFRGYFPTKIKKTVKSVGLDIKEHQDIKASLKSWALWMSIVADRLYTMPNDESEIQKTQKLWANRCRALSRRLRNLLELPLFLNVSDRTAPVIASSIYRKKPAYREFFRLYRDINLGIANILGDFLQIPLARTFDLYELWCFLRLLHAAVSRFQIPTLDTEALFRYSRATGSVTISASSITVPINNDFSLSFQRNYREFWIEPDRRGSFSRSMRPDVTVSYKNQAPDTERLIVLDAKYRINDQLNEAVKSIHMYRDALVEPDNEIGTRQIVIGAYLLSPYIGSHDPSWQNSRMPDRLFHPEYRSNFKFGAVTLRPGMQLAEIGQSLDAILNDAGVFQVPAGSQQAR